VKPIELADRRWGVEDANGSEREAALDDSRAHRDSHSLA
jgi:hypothetical protein